MKHQRRLLVLTLACLSLAGCATGSGGATTLQAEQAGEAELGRGMASWYGGRFHGRRTASGELFDENALTAAHPTLPFGARVRVRSLSNGREVVVRINDRGPHVKGRIIDLSRAAASALGCVQAGTARVVLLRP